MSRVPTARELEVLRYLDAGMRIGAIERTTYPVVAKGVTVIRLQRATVMSLFNAGWTIASEAGWTISRAGRDVVAVKAYVRDFAEGAQA